jgi:hypothetical protein
MSGDVSRERGSYFAFAVLRKYGERFRMRLDAEPLKVHTRLKMEGLGCIQTIERADVNKSARFAADREDCIVCGTALAEQRVRTDQGTSP